MWHRIRKGKHAVVPLFVAIAAFLIRQSPDKSLPWYAGIGLACLLGLAYVAEEIAWNLGRSSRTCAACGQTVPMKSFRIQATCPHCNAAL